MRLSLLFTSVAVFLCCACSNALDRAIECAGSNRPELEKVIENYRNDNPQKLRAAEFLIENMPAHYSYAGNQIYKYYDYATRILEDHSLTPEQQRDSLLTITDQKYSDLSNHTRTRCSDHQS